MIRAVLFDLDGTLADTATDLAHALNRLLTEEGLDPLPLDELRPITSNGTRGLLSKGFQLRPGDDRYAQLAERFLNHYEQALCVHTKLFPNIPILLLALEARGITWGVVTNKPARFTLPLLTALSLNKRAACIISGDTAARPKPAPDPLLLATEQIGIPPEECLYIGDDLRDVEAGREAGMRTVVVRYGYIGNGSPLEQWGADFIIDKPIEVLGLLTTGSNKNTEEPA